MTVSLAPPGLMPVGGYWQLPDEEKDLFRMRLRDAWHWPRNRIPTERQMVAVLHTYNRTWKHPIFYGGAMAGGKTSFLCSLAIQLCREIPNNRVLMFRKEYSAFASSTLQELQEQVESCPDARLWEGKHECHFQNGSEIWWMGVGTPVQRQKLGSTQFGAALGDEAPEMEHDIVRMVQTRIRKSQAAQNNRLLLVLTGNPYPGWIKQDFITAPRRGYTFIPALTSDNPHNYKGYAEDMREEMPDEWYRAFVLGDWNAMVPTTRVIPAELVARAMQNTSVRPDTTSVVWGIDVGHLGPDHTWIARRMGNYFDYIDGWGQKRTDETSDEIMRLLAMTTWYPNRIVVDYDGIGAGVADNLLRAQEYGHIPQTTEIVGVHAQARATIEATGVHASVKYANAKAQNAFLLRRLLEGKAAVRLPHDSEMEQDLTTASYDIVDGLVYIESKKLVRKKLGRSPDKGDALLLTMHAKSSDEFAGLPANISEDQMNRGRNLEVIEEEELAQLLMLHQKANWYRNPFGRMGVRGLLPGAQDFSDMA